MNLDYDIKIGNDEQTEKKTYRPIVRGYLGRDDNDFSARSYIQKDVNRAEFLPYTSKRNFSRRCCKTISSEPCICNGQHCMRAF